jgi:hypothetical protein
MQIEEVVLNDCGCAARFVLRRTFNVTIMSCATVKRKTKPYSILLNSNPTQASAFAETS